MDPYVSHQPAGTSRMVQFAQAHAALNAKPSSAISPQKEAFADTTQYQQAPTLEEALATGGSPSYGAAPFGTRKPFKQFIKKSLFWIIGATIVVFLIFVLLSPPFVRGRRKEDAAVVQRDVSIVRSLFWSMVFFVLIFITLVSLWATKRV